MRSTFLVIASSFTVACFPGPLDLDARAVDSADVATEVADSVAGDGADASSDAQQGDLDVACDDASCGCNDAADCDDHDACNGVETCVEHRCVDGSPVECEPSSVDCVRTVCQPATGTCVPEAAPLGAKCDDHDACTQTDECGDGVDAGSCVGTNPIPCPSLDACHDAPTCNPLSGVCAAPETGAARPERTFCALPPNGVEPGICRAGVCVRLPKLLGTAGHVCALVDAAHFYCWGDNYYGQLGLGSTAPVGDNEVIRDAGRVDLDDVAAFSVGTQTTCAANSVGSVRCWGFNEDGRLGYDDSAPRGTTVDTLPSGLPLVTIQAKIVALGLGDARSCAISDTGDLYCWGHEVFGYPDAPDIDISPETKTFVRAAIDMSPPETPLDVAAIELGAAHLCALTSEGKIRCWGDPTRVGLDLPVGEPIGSGPNGPSGIPFVNPDWDATQISVGYAHTCAVSTDGDLYCWGPGWDGQLGDGQTTPSSTPKRIEVGGAVRRVWCGNDYSEGITPGGQHFTSGATTCALLASGEVKCWGHRAFRGTGGVAPAFVSAADQLPMQLCEREDCSGDGGAIDIADECAVMRNGAIRCWGNGARVGVPLPAKGILGDEPGELPPPPIDLYGQ